VRRANGSKSWVDLSGSMANSCNMDDKTLLLLVRHLPNLHIVYKSYEGHMTPSEIQGAAA
jgi:hypothetical protein